MARGGFDYDVVILGSGFGGSLTALLLRRIGLRVLLVEREDHPRFAIGEATTPDTNLRLSYLARAYDLPLLHQLSSYCRIRTARLPIASWPKTCFYFVHHREGQPVDDAHPAETVQQTSVWPTGPDSHWLRSELDFFLKERAVEAGALYRPHTRPEAFRFSPERGAVLDLVGSNGTTHRVSSRLLVDATGSSSWLARYLDLRLQDSLDVPMTSASVFAHFRGVPLWEDLHRFPRLHLCRDEATVHHYYDGGWFWVIRFDNGVTSVGWVPTGSLEEGVPPEEQFWRTVRRFPSLAEILEPAEAVTPFYTIPRLQYSVRRMVGDGWTLLPHAAEFIDPFFSSGLSLTVAAVARLLHVVERSDPDRPIPGDSLAGVEENFRLEAAAGRKVITCVKRGFRDPQLFERAFALYRHAVNIAGYDLSQNTAEAALRPLFGAGFREVRDLVDASYRFFMDLDDTAPVDEKLLGEFDALFDAHDPYGFLHTRFGRYSERGVYYSGVFAHLDLIRKTRDLPEGLPRAELLGKLGQRWARGFLRPFRDAWSPGRVPSRLVYRQLRSLLT